jgi:peptide/nickel transport system substrate-binding protein
MQWKGSSVAFGVVLIAVTLFGFGARAGEAAAPVRGGTLNVGFVDDAKTLDPAHSVAWSERQILFLIYDSLIDIGTDFSLKPSLATSWDFQNGGKRIVLHLRTGVKFQDGTDFDADAVKWNLEWRMRGDAGSPQRSQLAPVIASIDVVDKSTAALNLKQPFPPLLALLTDRAGLMVSPTAVKKYGKDFGSNPVGTGPFEFKSWLRGSSVELVRNPGFWQKDLPYLDNVTFSDISTSVAGIQRLTTNELDFVAQLTPQDIRLVEGNSDVNLVQSPFGNWFALQWHWNEPPFNNPKLREAIAHAVNRQRINAILWAGRGTIANSETPPGLWWSPPNVDHDPYDPQLAKKLLAESGVAPGTELTLSAPSDDTLRQLVELVKEDLESIGLKVRLEPIAQSEWYARAVARQINFTPMRWTQRADPDGLIQFLFDSKGAANSTGYSNPDVDQLIGEARAIDDTTKRKALYDEIHQNIAHDLPYVSLAFSAEYFAMSKGVHGFVPMPDLIPRYRAMWKASN